jgi:hypothetical protein
MRHRPLVALGGRFSADVFRKPKWTLVGIDERMLCFSVGPDSNGTRWCPVPVFTDRPAVAFWRWELINFRMIMLCHMSFPRSGMGPACLRVKSMEVGVECPFFPSGGRLERAVGCYGLALGELWVSVRSETYLMSGAKLESTCT